MYLHAFADFIRSIVEDLSYGRSPAIYINRFRNYCTDTSGNWLVRLFNLILFI